MLSTFSHSFAFGHFYAFTTVLGQIILPYGFTAIDASYMSTAYQFSGIISGILTSMIMTKLGPKRFRIVTIIIEIMTLISKRFALIYEYRF